MSTLRSRLSLVIVVALVLCAATAAFAAYSTRNVFGYINNIGTSTGNIVEVKITDVTAGPTYGTVYYGSWGWAWWSPGNLRWHRNGLPTNKSYFVDIKANDGRVAGTGFWLDPNNSWDHQTPDTNFP